MFQILVLALGLTSVYGQLDSRTIMEYVKQEGMTTLAGFLAGTGLGVVFGDPKAPAMTLFAPSEAAWNKLPPNQLVSLATNTSALKSILTGHVIDEVVLSLYVRDKDTKTNLNGDPMKFRVYDNGVKTLNGALLLGSDVSLANGVVHKIDSIILPANVNIGEYVAQHPSDLKDLFGMLVLGRLFGTLETSGPFTLFAPVDSAFDAIRDNLTTLIQDRDAVAGITDGMVLQTVHCNNLTITVAAGGVMVDDAKVITTDIPTSNGVIHIVMIRMLLKLTQRVSCCCFTRAMRNWLVALNGPREL